MRLINLIWQHLMLESDNEPGQCWCFAGQKVIDCNHAQSLRDYKGAGIWYNLQLLQLSDQQFDFVVSPLKFEAIMY